MDSLANPMPAEGSQPAYAVHPHTHPHLDAVGPYHVQHVQPGPPPHLQARPHPHHSQSLPNIPFPQGPRIPQHGFTYPASLSSPSGHRPPSHSLSLPHALPHPHPSHLQQHPALHQNATCVPHLIRPGMDPTQVDMRSFYPYVPNEVKHRKRTSREQLKVLENMFKQETKPSATARKTLSAQLGMTPREVQVRRLRPWSVR